MTIRTEDFLNHKPVNPDFAMAAQFFGGPMRAQGGSVPN
jgi:hypothetical protein